MQGRSLCERSTDGRNPSPYWHQESAAIRSLRFFVLELLREIIHLEFVILQREVFPVPFAGDAREVQFSCCSHNLWFLIGDNWRTKGGSLRPSPFLGDDFAVRSVPVFLALDAGTIEKIQSFKGNPRMSVSSDFITRSINHSLFFAAKSNSPKLVLPVHRVLAVRLKNSFKVVRNSFAASPSISRSRISEQTEWWGILRSKKSSVRSPRSFRSFSM